VDTLDTVNVDMQVTLNNQIVLAASDSIANLLPLKSEEVSTLVPYSPSQTGQYQFVATALIDSTDGFPQNNLASLAFEVNDSVYARDEGNPAGFRSLGSNAGFMGQTFRLFFADTLTSISFYLNQATGQDTLRGAVYSFANSTPGALLARTDPWVVTPGYTGWITLGLEGIDLPLSAATYLFGLEEEAAGELNLGWTEGKYTAGAVWHRVETTWASADALDLKGVYMVRANLGIADEILAAAPAQETLPFLVSPNPGPGMFNLEFQTPLKAKTEISVCDFGGRVLLRQTLPAGKSAASIDLSDQPAGMYLLSVAGGTWVKLSVLR
jgi:hypothetical protein